MNIREPIVAGRFYPGKQNDLIKSIESCFLDEARGVGALPKSDHKNGGVLGLVVPHAGYMASGAIAAHAYSWLASRGQTDTVICLGPNHMGSGENVSVMTSGVWETPLGKIRIDSKHAKELVNNGLFDDTMGHLYEHSIEVQLPFLQYIFSDSDWSLIPISFAQQDLRMVRTVAGAISDMIEENGLNAVIIASSDFSHVGLNYGFDVPMNQRIDLFTRSQDQKVLDPILDFDPEGLLRVRDDEHISMCGAGPIATMMMACKQLGASRVELLKYGSSYEVWPDTSCVGYASIAVY